MPALLQSAADLSLGLKNIHGRVLWYHAAGRSYGFLRVERPEQRDFFFRGSSFRPIQDLEKAKKDAHVVFDVPAGQTLTDKKPNYEARNVRLAWRSET